MDKQRRIILLLASSLGILLGLFYLFRVQALRDRAESAEERVRVVSAAKALGIGEVLGGGNLQVREWPRRGLPERAVLAVDADLLAGRPLIHPLPAGEPVMWTDLPEGPRLRFPTEHIPAGYRTVALPAEEIRTLSHLLRPGDRVDVVWTSPGENGARLRTTVLGEAVQVFAARGRSVGEASEGLSQEEGSSITLLVRPGLALALCQAMQSGEVFLLARNREDDSTGPLRSLSSPLEAVPGGTR